MISSPMKTFLPLAAATLLASLATAQTPVTFGNILVVRSGDGSTSLGTAAVATFVDEYTPDGLTLVQTFVMPTAPSGPNRAFVNSGSATSEGLLSISSDGIYLALLGYDAAPTTPIVARTDSAVVNRVIATINAFTGTIDTSTALTDAFSSSGSANASPRSAYTEDGLSFWVGGAESGVTGTAGIRYVANVGATTSTQLAGTVTNIRGLSAYDGQLYSTSASTASGGIFGVAAISGGIPTTAGQTITLLNGFPNATGPSPYDFYWASPTTVYVADDRINGSGGIQKWTESGGVWTLQYTLALSPVIGCRGVTGHTVNGVTTLWATANSGTFTTSQTDVVTVVDTGPASVVTSIRTAAANTYFRGIRRFGKAPNFIRSPHGCAGHIRCTGNPEMGTELYTTLTGFAAVPFIGYGLTQIGAPLNFLGFPTCFCTLGHEHLAMFFSPTGKHTLSIDPSWATLGLNVYVQGVDLLLPVAPPCPDLGLTLTDTIKFTVQ